MITSQRGSREQAIQLQRDNKVPKEQCGPWFHGSGRDLADLTNKWNKVTWFTRSDAGGIPWGSYVFEAFIVEPLDGPHFADCGAGDPGGKDPEDPSRGLPFWWLKVNTAEIDKVMVVATIQKSKRSDNESEDGHTHIDFGALAEKLPKKDE